MQNLLKFIIRYYFFFLFVAFETVAVIILVNGNAFHRSKFSNLTRNIAGMVYNRVDYLREYLSLREENRKLIEENVHLKNMLIDDFVVIAREFNTREDTLKLRKFKYTSAKVINNTVTRQQNFITLNKGANHGIQPEMAVTSNNGIVGIVDAVSPNFSTVISVLNRNLHISAKLKKNNYFGSLKWDGKNFRKAKLDEIPHHVMVNVGDTIVTSGYSAIFPEGLLIGYVEDFDLEGGNFYSIDIKLSNDFKRLSGVNVIKNLLRKEQKKLEKESIKND
ncbi:MAG: rod shape-determining protein MreC [Bacteroidota bacterium]